MMFSNRLFVAAASFTLVASTIPSNLFGQQTTPDGVRVENAVRLGRTPVAN